MQEGRFSACKCLGDLVTAFVVRVAGVAWGVLPLDGGRVELVEDAPQVLVEHGLLRGRAPAAPLPAANPRGNALTQVLAVCDERDGEAGRGRAQPLNGRLQLHAVVGRRRDAPAQLDDAAIAVNQPRGPAPGPWVGRTGAVGENGQGLRGLGLRLQHGICLYLRCGASLATIKHDASEGN